MIKNIFIVVLLLASTITFSQELNCRVQVNAQKIQGTNKQVFENMQKTIYEFMNNTKWTPNVFAFDERIECTIQFNLTEQVSTDRYKGTVQIQSNRPVYNTSYNSVLLNFRDNDIEFSYVEFQTLDFNENTFTDNLTSILAYYAYLIIGYDYDTYAESGGTQFFEIGQKIVTNAQNSGVTGWKAFENKRNRYWIIENLLSSKYEGCRTFMYRYHRLGLDVMESKPTEGRQEIAEDLKLLQKVFRDKPDPQLSYLKLIFDAKADEFVNIFSEGFPDEKNRAYNILKEINPTNMRKYEAIKKPAAGQ